nr:hypothetical protein [Ktedonobacteraceae bacterium]
MKHWLAERLAKLLPELAPLGLAQEEEIKRICEEEIAAWKDRPAMRKASSLRVPMTDTRNAIKEAILVTSENRWYDEKNREWVPIALKYMAFSEEEYIAMNAPSEEVLQQRLQEQQELADPDAIVRIAEGLLQAKRWEDLAVGLALVTGRRLTEIMKTGSFHPKTLYSVTFDGQLKRRDIRLAPYELPTLVRAELVLDAWRRLRAEVDCTTLDNSQVAEKYSRIVSQNVNRHVAKLVPTTIGRDELHTHQLRAVYAAIAVYYYLPPRVAEIMYMATIDGHYRLLESSDQQQALNFASTAHYLDYKVTDQRRGIKLTEPGVAILEAFQKRGEQDMVRKAKGQATTEKSMGIVVKKQSKTGFSSMRPKQGTKERADVVGEREQVHSSDEIIVYLLDTDAIAQQLYSLLQPLAEELGTKTDAPVATLQALVAAYTSGVRSPEADQQAGKVAALLQEVAAEGEKQPVPYLRKLVDRDKKYKEG